MFKDYWDSPIAMGRLMMVQRVAITIAFAFYCNAVKARMVAAKGGAMRSRIRELNPKKNNISIILNLVMVLK